jgi:hypothetical protein
MMSAMHDAVRHVCPPALSKSDVSDALAAGWARVINDTDNGRIKLANALEVDGKTIGRTLNGSSVPELHRVMNSLSVDVTALNELFARYGMEVRPRSLSMPNDMSMIQSLARLVAQWVEVMEDGVRDHRETIALGDEIRRMMPMLQQIVAEADAIRGVVPIGSGSR